MPLPNGWTSERASGYFDVAHLIHERCGWRSAIAYDLVLDRPGVTSTIGSHECEDRRDEREDRDALHTEVAGLRTEVARLRAEVARLRTLRPDKNADASSVGGGHGWVPNHVLGWSSTRAFTNPTAPSEPGDQRVIVAQTAVCNDPTTGANRVGLALHYIHCEYASDPIATRRHITTTYQTVDVPVPCEVEAARVLAEFDPAILVWGGEGDPPRSEDPRTDWIEAHWPDGQHLTD